jgi:hypothetical protein
MTRESGHAYNSDRGQPLQGATLAVTLTILMETISTTPPKALTGYRRSLQGGTQAPG